MEAQVTRIILVNASPNSTQGENPQAKESCDKIVRLEAVGGPRQKSCGDNRHKALDFEVGDKVFLQLSPWKGVIRFGRKEKLSRRYIGPYEILACMGPVAYKSRTPTPCHFLNSYMPRNQDFTTKSITKMLMHHLVAWFPNLLRIALNGSHSASSHVSQCIIPPRVALARVPLLGCMVWLTQHLFLA
ncbi:gag-pol fusion protein [Cucumis melo var. makuwa]|uniref:Gag-pol fusion protein n=1 Tax=Cucumis melo var. makuwa TaxID=1194695 RepID=A0A5A7TG48_CUCMM|nr:gag-pol fusion protein [Cucumis melo var. makuwa]